MLSGSVKTLFSGVVAEQALRAAVLMLTAASHRGLTHL